VDAPIMFFFNFSKTIFCQNLPFTVAVDIFLRHNLMKFGDNRFLWLRDLTSYVTAGQAIFG